MIGDAPSQVNADALHCSVATHNVNVAEVAERFEWPKRLAIR